MNEETIISLAIDKSSRQRYRIQLSNPKQRHKILDKLNHNPPLDSRYTIWFSSLTEAVSSINVEPKTKVYILSAASEIDGQTMTFEKSIEAVTHHGWGSIIAVSTDLALYYGELGERTAVIKKNN